MPVISVAPSDGLIVNTPWAAAGALALPSAGSKRQRSVVFPLPKKISLSVPIVTSSQEYEAIEAALPEELPLGT